MDTAGGQINVAHGINWDLRLGMGELLFSKRQALTLQLRLQL